MDRIPRRLLVVGTALCVLAFAASVVFVLLDPDPAPDRVSIVYHTVAAQPAASEEAPAPQRVYPVVGGSSSYGRSHHGYPASDIIADCGLTYVAPYSGVVHEVNRVDSYDPATNVGVTRGGLSVAILGDDGVRYYGSHFSSINDAIAPGARVNAGDPVAIVGRTGDAGVCHVHFGLSPVCADGDWFHRRGVIWPWPYLDSWRGGGNADPAPAVNQWAKESGCPDTPSVEP